MWRRETLMWFLVGWRLLVSLRLRWRFIACSLQWRHNVRDSVSNHQPHDCFLKRLFRHRSKKTSKLRVAGLCAGNSPEAGEFPAQMASNAENVSIWWRHHVRAIPFPGLMITYRQLKLHKREAIAFYIKKITYFQWERKFDNNLHVCIILELLSRASHLMKCRWIFSTKPQSNNDGLFKMRGHRIFPNDYVKTHSCSFKRMLLRLLSLAGSRPS